jgi:osmotically inducible protein OsmC
LIGTPPANCFAVDPNSILNPQPSCLTSSLPADTLLFHIHQFMNRKASVVWRGNLRDGAGTLSTESGLLRDTEYSFQTRFEKENGTNLEELIAASLGGCFSMTLSDELERWGLHPERIETTAIATLEKSKGNWTLTRIELEVRAKIPNATQNHFIDAALAAKTNSPMARLLNTNISMIAHLDA